MRRILGLALLPLRIVHTFLVWGISYPFMITLAAIAAFCLLFLEFRQIHWFVGGGLGLVPYLTLGRVRVVYDEEFGVRRASVFCMNHTNVLDAHVACRTIPSSFGGVMNAWQFQIPGYGWIMRMAYGIPVHGSTVDSFREVEAGMRRNLAQGVSVLAFPEGHRTRTGRIGPFQRGIVHIASRIGAPIVPIAARGMYRLHKRRSFLFTPSTITVYFGPTIETSGLRPGDVKELTVRLQAFIAEFVEHGTFPDKAPLLEISSRARHPSDPPAP